MCVAVKCTLSLWLQPDIRSEMHCVGVGLDSVEMKEDWARHVRPVITANWPCCLPEGSPQFDTLDDRLPACPPLD